MTLLARQGFEAPQWHQLLGDDAPQPHDVEDDAPGIGRGWQKAASAALDLQRAAAHSDNLDAASAAMLLSQSGPCSAQVFLMLPVCPELIGARAFPCVAVATPALAFAFRPCAMPVSARLW